MLDENLQNKISFFTTEQKTLILICLVISASRLTLDGYLPSLPAIADYFEVSHSMIQFSLTAFLVGFAGSQIFYGPLSDRFGRRNIILLGFSIFLFGLLICLFSTSLNMLIMGRFITGLGAGVSSSLKRAIASDLFQDYRLAKSSATQSNATIITMLLAPIIGGFIQEHFGWRSNFFFIFIYVFIIYILLLILFQNTNNISSKEPITMPSFVKNYWIVLKYPLFYRNVFYSTCAFTGMAIFTQLSVFLLMVEVGRINAKHYGVLMTYLALSYFCSGIVVNRTVQKIGMYKLLNIGFLFGLLSSVLLLTSYLFHSINVIIILISAILFTFGARIVMPNAMARSLSPLPHLSGYASSLIGILQSSGAAIGSFIVTVLPFPNILLLAFSYLILSFLPFCIFLIFDEKDNLRNIEVKV